ncbi:MAG: SH3 domain-containing protein [Nitrospinota bacterium]|nr:SH3 domain-containing protein [Nitrospinota bacterium]
MRYFILSLVAVISVATIASAGQIITIMHKTTSLRADRQFFAPTIATASYGDQLPVVEEKGGWYKVAVGDKSGWVYSSATAKGKVAVTAKHFNKGAVSDQDVALAGKGFNEKVEGKYKKENPDMNYAAVDRMEKVNVSDGQINKFVAEGNLESRGE